MEEQGSEEKICQERSKTIKDFGVQWTKFTQNNGYYASVDVLQDVCGDLLNLSELKNKRVADVGSGTGRIVNMLLDSNVDHVTAIEPSKAFEVLKNNTRNRASKINYINDTGESIPKENFDYIFSIGVIHHIAEPLETLKAMHDALRPSSSHSEGGKCIIWVYGAEGNSLYLRFAHMMRAFTSSLPHALLKLVSFLLLIPLSVYIYLCKFVKLPMHRYMNCVLAKWDLRTRLVAIYDQLNPKTAKYYTKEEIVDLFKQAGFCNIKYFHRHAYSWTLTGTSSAKIQEDSHV